MSDWPIKLTPDEAQPDDGGQDAVQPEEAQPYLLAALIFGLFAALISFRLLFHAASTTMPGGLLLFIQIDIVTLVTLVVYIFFSVTKPPLRLFTLSVAAAELGLLYSLPTAMLFVSPRHHIFSLLVTLVLLLLAGIIGLLCAVLLKVERYPRQVILISFLITFVATNLRALHW